MGNDWTSAIERAQAYSPFLAGALDRLPELAALLADGKDDGGEAALAWARAAAVRQAEEGEPDIAVALRRERLALALALAIGDLAGAFPLARVTGGRTQRGFVSANHSDRTRPVGPASRRIASTTETRKPYASPIKLTGMSRRRFIGRYAALLNASGR